MMFFKRWFKPRCRCETQTFTKTRKEDYNTWYRCDACGREHALIQYNEYGMRVNPTLRRWYNLEAEKKANETIRMLRERYEKERRKK